MTDAAGGFAGVTARTLPVPLALAAWLWPCVAAAQPADEEHTIGTAPLDHVIVTARHRDERISDVPMAVTAIDGGTMRALGTEHVLDLQSLLPGLNLAWTDARNVGVSIRGIGNNPASESLETSVALYLDGVYLGRPGMAVLDLLDLEQVDLLRGPQGTLFGRNATAGVLHIRSRAPTFVPEAYAEASFGGRDGHRVRAMFSTPLSDTLAGRVSLYDTRDDGWLHNLHDGRTLNSVHSRGVRGQLLRASGRNSEIRLIADYHEEDDTTGVLALTGVGPAPRGFRNLEQAVERAGAGPLVINPGRRQIHIDGDERMHVQQGGVSMIADVRIGHHLLTSITAWRFWDYDPRGDIDRSNADIYRDLRVSVDHRQWSQELRLTSPAGVFFDYVLGAFLYHQNIKDRFLLEFGEHADIALLPFPLSDAQLDVLNGVRSRSFGDRPTRSGALFGQVNWHLTPRLDLTAGLRGTWEGKKARVVRLEPEGDPSPLPPVNIVRNALLGPFDSDEFGGLRRSEFSPSYLAALSWHPGDGALVWLSLSQSAKAGGFNTDPSGEMLQFDPERARSLELGVKHRLPRWRLLADANLFLTRVKGYQAQGIFHLDDNLSPVTALTNVGEIRSRGVEWNLLALPLRGLELGLNGAYTDARYRDFTSAPCPAEANPDAPEFCDLSGERVQGTPRWMVNTRAGYRWAWTAQTTQRIDIAWAWRSWRHGHLSNSRLNRLPGYALLHLGTTLERDTARGRLSLTLRAHNLLDKAYLQGGGATAVGNAYAASPGMPRTVSVALGWEFR